MRIDWLSIPSYLLADMNFPTKPTTTKRLPSLPKGSNDFEAVIKELKCEQKEQQKQKRQQHHQSSPDSSIDDSPRSSLSSSQGEDRYRNIDLKFLRKSDSPNTSKQYNGLFRQNAHLFKQRSRWAVHQIQQQQQLQKHQHKKQKQQQQQQQSYSPRAFQRVQRVNSVGGGSQTVTRPETTMDVSGSRLKGGFGLPRSHTSLDDTGSRWTGGFGLRRSRSLMGRSAGYGGRGLGFHLEQIAEVAR